MTDSLISAQDNQHMFDGIATRYDRMNKLMSFGLDSRWRRRAVQALAPSGSNSYLDVGCGTGDVIMELLRQSPSSTVKGIDPSANMLTVAKDKLLHANLSDHADLISADACNLPFADNSFAGIISAFCFRNITDKPKALAEMTRTLCPGGRLVLLELTTPPSSSWISPFYKIYSHHLIPLAGRLVGSKPAYQYLIRSIDDFSHRFNTLEIMKEAGLSKTSQIPLNGGIVTVFVGQHEQLSCPGPTIATPAPSRLPKPNTNKR